MGRRGVRRARQKKEDEYYLIFFSPMPKSKERYQIFIAGRETGVIVSRKEVMKLLTTEQYRDFCEEIGIYEIAAKAIEPILQRKGKLENGSARWRSES